MVVRLANIFSRLVAAYSYIKHYQPSVKQIQKFAY